ncbi:hypothetical protein G6514_001114 [Epicoccum nigrum]|nr:hypothetical protein G6514_001114 [Epicoccum nigrum]
MFEIGPCSMLTFESGKDLFTPTLLLIVPNDFGLRMKDPVNHYTGVPLRMGESYFLVTTLQRPKVLKIFQSLKSLKTRRKLSPLEMFKVLRLDRAFRTLRRLRLVNSLEKNETLMAHKTSKADKTHKDPKTLRTRSKTKPRKMCKPLRSSRIPRPLLNLETRKMPKVSRTFALYSTSSTPR